MADTLTANIDFSPCVDAKSVRDRQERLEKTFDANDDLDAMTSGVAGEISGIQALLSHIQGAREEEQVEKTRVLKVIKVRGQRKLEAGE